MTVREREQLNVDGLNEMEGERHLEDGYHCKLCRNKGFVAVLRETGPDRYETRYVDCRCVETRASILRMKRSGLKDIVKDYALEKFEATEPWQQTIKKAAEGYAKEPKGWFFIGGQSGAGKTHICTAICRELLLQGRSVTYMLWRDDIVRLNSIANEYEAYGAAMDRYKKADVLYIDDLFKTGRGRDGERQHPTGGDINRAFELINHRYNKADSVTIISSECTADDLIRIDEAVGGRIFERAQVFNLGADQKKNYRLRKVVEL